LSDHNGGLYLGITTFLEWYRGLDYKRQVADGFKYTDVIEKALRQYDGGKDQIFLKMHM